MWGYKVIIHPCQDGALIKVVNLECRKTSTSIMHWARSREQGIQKWRSKICSFHKSLEDEYLGADMIEKL